MKNLYNLITLFSLFGFLYSSVAKAKPSGVVVKINKTGKEGVVKTYRISDSFIMETISNTEANTSCQLKYMTKKSRGAIDCEHLLSGAKAQVSFDCSLNTSSAKAAHMFISLGKSDIGSFNIYTHCK